MAASLLGGAAVGAVFGELLKAVLKAKDKGTTGFSLALVRLRSSLEAITPLISEIEQRNNELNRPPEEIERLVQEMEDAKVLVRKCSKIRRWHYWTKLQYENRLLAVDNSLLRFFNVDLQAQMARDQKQTLMEVKKLESRVEKLHLVVKKIKKKKEPRVSLCLLITQKTQKTQGREWCWRLCHRRKSNLSVLVKKSIKIGYTERKVQDFPLKYKL